MVERRIVERRSMFGRISRIFGPEQSSLNLENRWPEFQALLFDHGWIAPNVQRVKEGYIIAQGAFFGQPRKSGQDWMFSHGEQIAKKIIVEWGYKDPVIVIAALNHDTIEDTVLFELPYDGSLTGVLEETAKTDDSPRLWLTNSQKRDFARTRFVKHFSKDTAKIVMPLTRPEVDHIEILNREHAQEMYVKQITEAEDIRVLVIKLEDNIINLEEPFDPDAHERKKEQIRRDYLQIYYDRLLTIKGHKLEVAKRRLQRLEELLDSESY